MYWDDIFGNFGWLNYYFFAQQDEPSRESNHSEKTVNGFMLQQDTTHDSRRAGNMICMRMAFTYFGDVLLTLVLTKF